MAFTVLPWKTIRTSHQTKLEKNSRNFPACNLTKEQQLRRKVTPNPIETAKVFNVPQFRMTGLGYSAKDIIKDVGSVRVQYVPILEQDATVSSMELRPI